MPQLSPMMGFVMSIAALGSLLLLMISLKKVSPKITTLKSKIVKVSSFPFF